MVARCKCGLTWNISIKAKIPKEGYKCPWCREKEKKEVAMVRRLTIKFKDGSKVTYTINRSYVDPMQYFNRHSINLMESAILQTYPKKDNLPVDLLALELSKKAEKLMQEDITGTLTIAEALRKVSNNV